jgi:hypothetical protein
MMPAMRINLLSREGWGWGGKAPKKYKNPIIPDTNMVSNCMLPVHGHI